MYINSEGGILLLSRTETITTMSNEDSSGFLRIYYGWMYFNSMSFFEQLFGVGNSVCDDIFSDGFSNCASYIFIAFGLIGGLMFLWFYIKLCVNTSFVAFAFVCLFLFISMMEAIYLHPIMLICTVIPIALKKT